MSGASQRSEAWQPIRYPFETPPAAGEVIEIAQGVLWTRMPLPMVLDHVNLYLFEEEDGWVMIDAGMDTPVAREAFAKLLAGPMASKPLKRLIVTHHHPDHIGLAGHIVETTGAELWTTRTAWLYARVLQMDVEEAPSAESLAYWRRLGMDAAIYDERAKSRPMNFADVSQPIPRTYRRLIEGQEISFGGRRWAVRMGDGHAPEHATFWSLDDHLVVGGDQLLPGISANIGVYVSDPEADPLGEWLDSCARLSEFARDEHLTLPGHKLPFTGLPIRLQQMAENHHGALARLLKLIAEPRRAPESFTALFKREIGPREYGLALAESVAHLNHLTATGRARRFTGEDGVWRWQALP